MKTGFPKLLKTEQERYVKTAAILSRFWTFCSNIESGVPYLKQYDLPIGEFLKHRTLNLFSMLYRWIAMLNIEELNKLDIVLA